MSAQLAQKTLTVATKLGNKAAQASTEMTGKSIGYTNTIRSYTAHTTAFLKLLAKREHITIPNKTQFNLAQKEWSAMRTQLRKEGSIMTWPIKNILERAWIVVELLGWLFVGEVLGRRQLVGYKH